MALPEPERRACHGPAPLPHGCAEPGWWRDHGHHARQGGASHGPEDTRLWDQHGHVWQAHYAACTTQGCEAPRKEGAMIAPLTEIIAALPQARASKVLKLSQEGMMAGTWGAATISLWFLLLDVLAGHPLYTPHVLGTALFQGGEGRVPPAHLKLSLGIVVAFTALHWLAFVLT